MSPAGCLMLKVTEVPRHIGAALLDVERRFGLVWNGAGRIASGGSSLLVFPMA